MNKIMVYLAVRIFLGMLIGAVGTVIIRFVFNALIMPFRRKGALLNAKRVEAERVDYIYPRGVENIGTESYVWGIYEYEVNGRKYKYKARYVSTPPSTEILYYKKNPAKATNSVSYGKNEFDWKPIFIVLTLVGFVYVLLTVR